MKDKGIGFPKVRRTKDFYLTCLSFVVAFLLLGFALYLLFTGV